MTSALRARHVIDQQPVERVDLDVRASLEHLAHDLDALLHAEQGRFLDVHQDRDDDLVEQVRAPLDDVDVPVGQRIERAWINGEFHVSRGRLTPLVVRASAPPARDLE